MTRLTAQREAELIAAAQAGDVAARNALVESLLPTIRYIAHRYQRKGWQGDDLISVGALGAMRAIEAFDTTHGCRLTTLAQRCIVGQVQDFLRDEQPKGYRKKKGRHPSIYSMEIATRDDPRFIDPADTSDAQLRDRRESEQHAAAWLDRKLNHREAHVMRRHVIEGCPQHQIASELGVSPARVSHIVTDAKRQLRRCAHELIA